MIKYIVHAIHHLFNPHCPECAHERECKNCQIFRDLFESERFEKNKLLQALINKNTPVEVPEVITNKSIEPIQPKHIPWAVRRQMLEAEDRQKAKILREQKLEQKSIQSIEELEEELGIAEES